MNTPTLLGMHTKSNVKVHFQTTLSVVGVRVRLKFKSHIVRHHPLKSNLYELIVIAEVINLFL